MLVGPSLGAALFTFAAWVPLLTRASALVMSVVALRRLPARAAATHTAPRSPMRTAIAEGL